MIAFVGSVFSPYYRRALLRDPQAAADEHCAINVCVYSPGAKRWTMTERGRRHVQRGPHEFAVGPSRWGWSGSGLTIDIDERATPMPRRVIGTLRVQPLGLSRFTAALDGAGRHRWGPIAPGARIDVDLHSPALRWQGQAYIDSNEGDEPIEQGFTRWDWLRAQLPDGRCAVVYDVQPRGRGPQLISAAFGADGAAQPWQAPPRQHLPPSPLWRVQRAVRADAGPPAPRVAQTLEDTPFYARSLLRLQLGGQSVQAVHESLDVNRLASPWVQRLLPFRMPRRT